MLRTLITRYFFCPKLSVTFSIFLKACFVITIFSFLVLATQAASAATPSGGPGQRACCVVERVPSCNPGNHEVIGCSGDCKCGGANPLGALNSTGRCVPNAPPPVITTCGGPGQRACCVTERIPSCNPGHHEVPGCSGNCTCGGPNPAGALKSIGRCEPPTCGGLNQRACCVTERPIPCNPGLIQVPGCTGNCKCGGVNPAGALNSLGKCVGITTHSVPTSACGGLNQRACCVTERIPSCNPGLHEVLGCSGNCTCGGPNPAGALKSIGRCEPQTCGGLNQRACCVTERPLPCNPGLIQFPGCTGDCKCGGVNPAGALISLGKCVAIPTHSVPTTSACGGQGQRACCVTERIPSCNPGLFEVSGCTGDCKCGGANPLGALNALGHCESGCSAAMNLLKKREDDLAAARRNAQQFCGQAPAPMPQQMQMQMQRHPALIPVQKKPNSF